MNALSGLKGVPVSKAEARDIDIMFNAMDRLDKQKKIIKKPKPITPISAKPVKFRPILQSRKTRLKQNK